MTNDLQRQVFGRQSPEPGSRSEATSTVQAQHDASSRTQSVAAPSTRCMTPEPGSVRRETPSVAGSSSGSSQQASQSEKPPAEYFLSDLIDADKTLKDSQISHSRAKRRAEDEAEDEPSSKRDRLGQVDKLGEELEELDKLGKAQGDAASTSVVNQTPEAPRQQQIPMTPPDSNRRFGSRHSLPMRVISLRQKDANVSPDDAPGEDGSSDDETCRDPGTARQSPRGS